MTDFSDIMDNIMSDKDADELLTTEEKCLRTIRKLKEQLEKDAKEDLP